MGKLDKVNISLNSVAILEITWKISNKLKVYVKG